jgi:hypothetical protein
MRALIGLTNCCGGVGAGTDKSLYCFGGYDGSYRNDFHEFNFGAFDVLSLNFRENA